MENPNQSPSRRNFLRTAAGAACVASSGSLVTRMAAQSPESRVDILLNERSAGGIVRHSLRKREQFRRHLGKLIHSDAALHEEVFDDRDRRKSVWPARIERQMRDEFRDLSWSEPTLECLVEIVWHRDRLISCGQG